MFFEDFEPNSDYTIGDRTINADDIDRFIALSGLDNLLFTSDKTARERGHSSRLVPGPLLLSLAMGMVQQAGLFNHVVAVLEFERLRFLAPVHPGDAISLTASVAEKRPTSNPKRGLVLVYFTMTNQDQKTVMSARARYLMARRDQDV
jgi:acyl dehydratase